MAKEGQGKDMAQQSARQDRENQHAPKCSKHAALIWTRSRTPIRASGMQMAASKAGYMTAPDARYTTRNPTCARGGNGMDPALAVRWNLERQLR